MTQQALSHVLSQLITRLLLVTVVVGGGLMSSSAHADQSGADFKTFSEQVRQAQASCSGSPDCVLQGYQVSKLYDGTKAAPGIEVLLPRFQSIAADQASIWGDTILEGPFDADGQTALTSVEGVYKNGDLVAYHITYMERAWRLTDEGNHGSAGSIFESSYVSPSFTSWFRDDMALADFRD